MSQLAQTSGWKPPSPTRICWCSAHYVDDPEGRQAHRDVFHHDPAEKRPEGGGDGD